MVIFVLTEMVIFFLIFMTNPVRKKSTSSEIVLYEKKSDIFRKSYDFAFLMKKSRKVKS